MKHILSFIMVLCVLFCMTIPAMAMEPGALPDDKAVLGESTDGLTDTATPEPLSAAITYYTQVKVSVVDQSDNPLAGGVFQIYRAGDDAFMQEIVSDSSGIALSEQLPADSDYYMLEITAPKGYQWLCRYFTLKTIDFCANTRTDLTVRYSPITGQVKAIKSGDDGKLLSSVSFGIYDANNIQLSVITTGSAGIDGVAVSGTLNYGEYYLKELSTVGGYELLTEPIPFTIEQHNATVELPVVNKKIYGSVSLLKLSGSMPASRAASVPLSGAVFGLYTEQGQKLTELTTGTDGYANYNGLPQGNYYLKELSAPQGYVKSDDTFPFIIQRNGDVAEIIAFNQMGYGTVKVQRTGENGLALSGVTFDVYCAADNKKVDSVTTDGNGIATSELPLDSYYLIETVTAPGYVLHNGRISFALVTDGETVTLPIQNIKEAVPTEKQGKLLIIKKADKTGEKLKGSIFGVYEKLTDKKVTELTTDRYGEATVSLDAGDYYLRELEAPAGYVLNASRISFSIKAEKVEEITVTNKTQSTTDPTTTEKPGKLLIIKKADKTGEKLKGAVFGVYETLTDKKVIELTTDRYGEATVSLDAGDYYLRELEAPAGYVLNASRISFSIKAEKVEEITVTNKAEAPTEPTPTEKPGKLLIIKKADKTGEKLKGAIFGVYEKLTDKKVTELTTDRYGEATVSLDAGDYYLRELEAPIGYVLNASRIYFSIKAEKVEEITVTNKAEAPTEPTPTEKPGKLLIIKKADKTGEKLKGAVFGVYETLTDKKVTELTTDRYGETTVSLDAGDYYLRELEAPTGYVLSTDRISFRIKSEKIEEIVITNKAVPTDNTPSTPSTPTPSTPSPSTPQPSTPSKPVDTAKGKLELVKKAEGTGKPLSGAVFGVYNAQNNTKVGEVTSDNNGKATLLLPDGRYYLLEQQAPQGYLKETAKILFTVKARTTTIVEVTNMRDPDSMPYIQIPKTGESYPTASYMLAVFLLAIAAICGVLLYLGRKSRAVNGDLLCQN